MSEYLEHITSVEDMKDKINDFALDMYNKGRADEQEFVEKRCKELGIDYNLIYTCNGAD